jgi:hypothetical protein
MVLSLVRSLDARSRTFFAMASSREIESRAAAGFLAPLRDFTSASAGFDDLTFRFADEALFDLGIVGR